MRVSKKRRKRGVSKRNGRGGGAGGYLNGTEERGI